MERIASSSSTTIIRDNDIGIPSYRQKATRLSDRHRRNRLKSARDEDAVQDLMIISRNNKSELVQDEVNLTRILEQRDERGGGEFWLSQAAGGFPCLAIVVAGILSNTTYFPEEGHPGFRHLRDDDEPALPGVETIFVWLGCDPSFGEQVPNEFVVPFSTSLAIAKEFLGQQSLPKSGHWFEL